jgi:hypothetical protein
MELLGDRGEARLSPFEDSANLTKDMCLVCSKHTIGSEIILDVPDGTARLVGLALSHFGPFGNSVSVSAL